MGAGVVNKRRGMGFRNKSQADCEGAAGENKGEGGGRGLSDSTPPSSLISPLHAHPHPHRQPQSYFVNPLALLSCVTLYLMITRL